MKKISSDATSFFKKLNLAALVLFTALYLSLGLIYGAPVFAIMSPFMIVLFIFLIPSKFIFPLLDEVFDGGDYLLLKNSNKETKLSYNEIVKIKYNHLFTPSVVVLTFNNKTIFGKRISFIPDSNNAAMISSTIIDVLKHKIQTAKKD